MAYNTLRGTVNFSNSDTGSIESMIDNYSNQTIGGLKTFASVLSASSISTDAGSIVPPAITSIASDSADRVLISNGNGTLYGSAALTFTDSSLTASYFSGSGAGITGLEIGGDNVNGQLSASHIYLGNGMASAANKLTLNAGDGITVGASGIELSLKSNGGLTITSAEARVNPSNSTVKASLSDADTFLISDSDASSATKKSTLTVLTTYMQNGLTFTAPGGANDEIQTKAGTSFAGSSKLTFSDGAELLTVLGSVSASAGLNAASLGISGSATISGSLRAHSLHTTIHSFNNPSTDSYYIPFVTDTGATTPTYLNHMIAPANGRLVKALVRVSDNDVGSVAIDIHATAAASATLAGSANKERIQAEMNLMNVTVTFSTSGSNHFNTGDIVGIKMGPSQKPENVNITCVWEYDFTNT
jgi:hypothetical protein